MSEERSGGCLCGAVRYTISGALQAVVVCHCGSCQRQSGSAFSLNAMIGEAQIVLTGTPHVFTEISDSGSEVYRHFCAQCGAPLLSKLQAMPGMAAVKVGTLDDTAGLAPIAQLWCTREQDWLNLNLDTPRFDKNPPAQ